MGSSLTGWGTFLTQHRPVPRITVMSWKGLLVALLLASPVSAVPADEVESTPGLSDDLTLPFVQRLRDLAAPATDKLYAKCLATFASPALCECLTRRIPLRFDWLCEVKVIGPQRSNSFVSPLATVY